MNSYLLNNPYPTPLSFTTLVGLPVNLRRSFAIDNACLLDFSTSIKDNSLPSNFLLSLNILPFIETFFPPRCGKLITNSGINNNKNQTLNTFRKIYFREEMKS